MGTSPGRSGHRPIFIVGAPGSGSTLLRLMLDSHEHIAIPQETGFLRLARAHTWVPYWALGGEWSANLDLSEDELAEELADFYGGLFERYAARRGKERWGEKTPFHVWHLDLATRLFPQCQVVGIVRHPGAVVVSQRRRFRRAPEQAARQWRRSTTRLLHEAITLGDRCVMLRYEDLVADPESVLRPLLDWLGEPWSAAVLDHHEVQPGAGAPDRAEGFTDTSRAVDSASVDTWEKYLQGEQRTTVLAPTAPTARFLGYDPERAGPLGEFGVDGVPLITGTQLAALRATRDSDIDWANPPEPSAEDRQFHPPMPHVGDATSLDQVRVTDLLRNRLTTRVAPRLPAGLRKRAHDLRRSLPALDRLIGPR
jgi:hypothetical protein